MTKELVCINCPMGCRMTVTLAGEAVEQVTGNHCKRGSEYAVQEAVRPMRVLTGNMKARGCARPFSVRTSGPIPKAMLLSCAAELKRHHPAPPIALRDVVLSDLCGTGADVIATQSVETSDEGGAL